MTCVNTMKSYRNQVNALIVHHTRYQLMDHVDNKLVERITVLELMESVINVLLVKRLVQMAINVLIEDAQPIKSFLLMVALIVKNITMLIH